MARTAKKDDVESKTIHPEVTKSLIAKTKMLMSEMDEPRGELGAHMKEVEKTHGLNRKAFKTIVQLDRMEETQRNDMLRTFDMMRSQMNWDAQGDFFAEKPKASAVSAAGSEAEGDQAAKDEKQVSDNVTMLKKGIKPTAEATA
jgi:uncharacterized protein (UPF0335 family)